MSDATGDRLSVKAAVATFLAATALIAVLAPALDQITFLHEKVRDSLIGASSIVCIFLYRLLQERRPLSAAATSSWDWVAGAALASLLVFAATQAFACLSAVAVIASFNASGLTSPPMEAFDASGVVIAGAAAMLASAAAGVYLARRVTRPLTASLLMAILFVGLNLALSLSFNAPAMSGEPVFDLGSALGALPALALVFGAIIAPSGLGVVLGRRGR